MNVQLLIKEILPETPVFKGIPGDMKKYTNPQSESGVTHSLDVIYYFTIQINNSQYEVCN